MKVPLGISFIHPSGSFDQARNIKGMRKYVYLHMTVGS